VQKNFLFFTIFNVNLCEFMKNNVISRNCPHCSLIEMDTPIINLMERFDNLNLKYLNSALVNGNELIHELYGRITWNTQRIQL
jgi:hypothetical protein